MSLTVALRQVGDRSGEDEELDGLAAGRLVGKVSALGKFSASVGSGVVGDISEADEEGDQPHFLPP